MQATDQQGIEALVEQQRARQATATPRSSPRCRARVDNLHARLLSLADGAAEALR